MLSSLHPDYVPPAEDAMRAAMAELRAEAVAWVIDVLEQGKRIGGPFTPPIGPRRDALEGRIKTLRAKLGHPVQDDLGEYYNIPGLCYMPMTFATFIPEPPKGPAGADAG